MSIQYLRTYEITAMLTARTGLRIGAGKDSVEIGGIDSPVVKHPHSLRPYVPGSSIKGKLRSMLEWALNCVEPGGEVWGTKSEPKTGDVILRTFGVTSDKWREGPTRLIVRDAHLEDSWYRGVTARGLPLTEAKTEVTIDRIQGKGIGPRTMERVPAGSVFQLEMLFRRYSVDGDNRDVDCLNRVIEAMRLLEQDALGGSGSRGYGRVEFSQVRIDGTEIMQAFRQAPPFDRNRPQQFLTE